MNAVYSVNTIFAGKNATQKKARKLHMSERSLNIIVGTVLVFIFGLSAYLVAVAGFGAAVVDYLTNLSVLWQLLVATAFDLLRIAIVFMASFLIMVPLAIYFGSRGSSGRLGTGVFQVIYSIPAPILFPLIVV
jgi:ABC-type anion transport system duplicated permease subunit